MTMQNTAAGHVESQEANMGQQRLCITVTAAEAKELFDKTFGPLIEEAASNDRYDFVIGACMAAKALINCEDVRYHAGLMQTLQEAQAGLLKQTQSGNLELGKLAGITTDYVNWLNGAIVAARDAEIAAKAQAAEEDKAGSAVGDPT